MEWAEGIGCERACSDVTPSRIFCTESPYHASPLRVENSSSAMCLHSVSIRNNGLGIGHPGARNSVRLEHALSTHVASFGLVGTGRLNSRPLAPQASALRLRPFSQCYVDDL